MKYAVVAQYQHGNYERFEIISLHKSYELASKACKHYDMRGIREVSADAKRGDIANGLNERE